MSSRSSAPTGHYEIAQGETLGIWPTPTSSPERAQPGRWGINSSRCRPFRAENDFDHLTHGVAIRTQGFTPGYRMAPLWSDVSIP
jgi:hypothetical protein